MYEQSTGCIIKITDQYQKENLAMNKPESVFSFQYRTWKWLIKMYINHKCREGLQLMTSVTYICHHYCDLTSSKMMTGREKAGSLSVHTDDALLLHGHTAREPGG